MNDKSLPSTVSIRLDEDGVKEEWLKEMGFTAIEDDSKEGGTLVICIEDCNLKIREICGARCQKLTRERGS